jgi:TonB family protein
LKTDLASSSDATLVGTVGERLAADILPPQACPDSCTARNDAVKNATFQLLQRASNLQPYDALWPHALNMAKRTASGQMPLPPAGPQRIGAQVMEANLIKKVQPVYPALAKSAGVQGTVEFTATVDETGHVVNLQLVRGHPLLVNAAREAVLQWTYRPTLLNGQPVTVISDVSVNFTLDNLANPAQPAQPPK